jgi:nitrite reductase (NADH) small subunit
MSAPPLVAEWVAVGRAADVPLLEGRSVRVGGARLAIFRLPEGWAAIDHACPHEAGPLSDGLVADACVTCPLHGWRFDLRTGERAGGGPGVAVHEVRERDGVLEVRLAE